MENVKDSGFINGIIKGVATVVIITLVSVLIFAGVVKLATLNSSVIKAVNQFIKIVSIFLGCSFTIKASKGLVKGVLVGAVSTIITYLLFALIGGGVAFGLNFILDVVLGLIVGGISGVIAVNFKKN